MNDKDNNMTLLVFASMLAVVCGNVDYRSNLNLASLDVDAWWGHSQQQIEDNSIKRVRVEFRDDATFENEVHKDTFMIGTILTINRKETCIDFVLKCQLQSLANGATAFSRTENKLELIGINFLSGKKIIHDLKYRLSHRRPIIPSPEGAWFEYGINSHVVEDWLNYWETEYPFKERERILNQFSHYTTNIQGLDVHFIRARPKVPKNATIVPLLLMNGFPSSFVEFSRAIPFLTQLSTERDFAVEVIFPTIPGFTLSEAASRPGLGPPEIAVIMRKLMHRLGHMKYYMASQDMGYFICNFIATAYPEDVLGFYTQFLLLLSLPANVPFVTAMFPLTENSIYLGNNTKGRTGADNYRQGAYLHHQATTPDTLGNAYNDSPVGLLSYILQMFFFGLVLDRRENAGARIDDFIPRDALLDNIMLYWATGSIGTSMRLYRETFNPRILAMNIDETPSPVLTWITHTKYEIFQYPVCVMKAKYPNLITYRTLDFGGHSYGLEYPEVYADDVLTAITAFRNQRPTYLKDEL